MHGKGEYTWKDGKTYKGDFKHDKREGNGEMIWASGKSYQGEWVKGEMHGNGKLTNKDGTKSVEGIWCKGHQVKQ
jgi:hypothetical protein